MYLFFSCSFPLLLPPPRHVGKRLVCLLNREKELLFEPVELFFFLLLAWSWRRRERRAEEKKRHFSLWCLYFFSFLSFSSSRRSVTWHENARTTYPTNNGPLINFRLSSEAEILLKKAPTEHTNRHKNVQKHVSNVCIHYSNWASTLHTTVGGWARGKKNKPGANFGGDFLCASFSLENDDGKFERSTLFAFITPS